LTGFFRGTAPVLLLAVCLVAAGSLGLLWAWLFARTGRWAQQPAGQ
jgi:hypothetical protein